MRRIATCAGLRPPLSIHHEKVTACHGAESSLMACVVASDIEHPLRSKKQDFRFTSRVQETSISGYRPIF